MADLLTNDAPEVQACTLGGLSHDWRPMYDSRTGYHWCCVWCHAVTCGNYGEPDPCWLPYHHREPHRSRAGVVWPLGEMRPDRG